MKAILVGFMGSGKTTVGTLLAQKLGIPYHDLDDMIVSSAGKSIKQIFAEDGEPTFRQLEHDALKKALNEVNPHSWMKNSNYGGFTMTKFSFEVKLKAVQMYLAGIGSPTIARRLGIKGKISVQTWVARYRKYGIQGLEIRSPKFDYDGDFKLKVLNWKKQHKASYPQTALQFDISNPGTIANWQRKLKERGIEALFTRRGRANHMMTNHNHQARKQLSELERLKADNRALKVENEYLKKLEALVQRRGQSKKNIKSSKN